ncbi:MAG TPA: serine hydrolase domain-containing protein [Candidatus Dormibacteraeota bacterium]|nr:serine hydrolase domain-containing protein [Candidatus Dormibacteraeota bacterium]
MAQVSPAVIQGTCDPRFEAVRQEFERNFSQRGEVGASVSITVEGTTVVDLWGGFSDPESGRPWEKDTVVVVWSCTKGATAICAHILVSRDELDLEAPVAAYWPEFAQSGKDGIPVRMLLNHQAGLAALRKPLPPGAFYDWDLMTSALAAEAPFWTPGLQHGYHGLTFGFLVGEVIRRVSGKSPGRFFKDEVADRLGIDFHIGLHESQEARVSRCTLQPPPDPNNLTPAERQVFSDPTSVTFLMLANNGGYMMPGECDTRAAHAAEIPSAGGISNARGLAGLYAPIANGGGPLLDEGSVRRMGAVSSASGVDATLFLPTRFSLGFVKAIDNRRHPAGGNNSLILSEEAFGHSGLGGSIGFADPRARMSFGYAMNKHGAGMGLNDRGQSLIDAAYRSLGFTSDAFGTWA